MKEKIYIDKIKATDKEAFLEIIGTKSVAETYMLPDFKSEAEMVALFERFIKLSCDDSRFIFGIYADELLVGFINDVEIQESFVEIGYVVNPSYSGRGYATEGVKQAISIILDAGYPAVRTGAFETNTASIRVMEKCGMKRIAYEDDIEYRGKTHHCIYYEIRA